MWTKRDLLSLTFGICLTLVGFGASPARAQHEGHGQAAAPTSGLRAELIRDIEDLERKYVGLAEAMSAHYAYSPGEGVRSASQVLMHVAGANLMLPTMAGVQPPEAYRAASMDEAMGRLRALEQETDPAKVQSTLREAFAHARHAVASVSDAQLDETTNLFGQEATKRRVLLLIVTHMHEHLGQAIAYARASGVTPPWSE